MRFRRSQAPPPISPYRFASRILLLASILVAACWYSGWRPRGGQAPDHAELDLDLSPSPFPDLGQGVFETGGRQNEISLEPDASGAADALGVDRQLLLRVLDKTKGIPERPYYHLVDIAARTSTDELLSHAHGENRKTYVDLWKQPEKHRGELIYLKGHLRGLSKINVAKAAVNPAKLEHLYQGDLFTPAASPRPFILVMPNVPAGLPEGKNISENVSFVGFFLKQWRYESAEGVDRAAPLLIGRMVSWQPAPAHDLASPFRTYVGWGIVLSVVVLGAVVWMVRRVTARGPKGGDAQLPEGELAAVMSDLEGLKTVELPPSFPQLENIPAVEEPDGGDR